MEENKEIIGEHLVEENTSEKTGKTYNKKAKNEFHEKKCKVIHYNRHTKTLDIQFDGYGIRKVRHIKHQDGLLVSDLPGIKADDLAPDDHLSHFSLYIFYGDGFLLKISSVNHIRMIGTL